MKVYEIVMGIVVSWKMILHYITCKWKLCRLLTFTILWNCWNSKLIIQIFKCGLQSKLINVLEYLLTYQQIDKSIHFVFMSSFNATYEVISTFGDTVIEHSIERLKCYGNIWTYSDFQISIICLSIQILLRYNIISRNSRNESNWVF